jgi:hypothetical protein
VKPTAATESIPEEPTQNTIEKDEESTDSDKATFASTGTNEASVNKPLVEKEEDTNAPEECVVDSYKEVDES